MTGKNLQELLSDSRRENARQEVLDRISKIRDIKDKHDAQKALRNPSGMGDMTAASALQSDDPEAAQFREYLSSLIDTSETHEVIKDPELEKEIKSLRRELDRAQRALKRAEVQDFPYPFGGVHLKLVAAGLTSSHAAMLVRRAQANLAAQEIVSERHVFHLIQSEISALFQGYDSYVVKPKAGPRVAVLMGATGVGKTTTIMKLASKPKLLGAKKLAIVSTDSYRIAAASELEIFSNITKIPFYKTKNLQELDDVMATLQDFDLVLVDTPARSPAFPGVLQEMQEVLNLLKPTDVLLTLSMASDLKDLFMSSGLFMSLKPTGLIFTKLDETCRQGKMITLAAEIGLPIAFVSDGQKIPDALHIPNGIYIWDKLLNALDN